MSSYDRIRAGMHKTVVVLTALAVGIATLSGVAAFAQPHPGCRQVATRVHLAVGDVATYRVAGTLCGRPPIVELAVHGASYSRTYWFGPGGSQYDYAASQVHAGLAVLAVDMPGAGTSDHPDPALLTFSAMAHVVHQLAQDLRNGTLGRYRAIVGVGHSMGAGALQEDAGTPEGLRDFDGLILADFLHQADPAGVAQVQHAYVPAPGLPPGYLTITDRSVFYNMAFAQARVVVADRPTSFSVAQAQTLGVARDPRFTQAIRVAPLIVVGQEDSLGCGPALSCADSRSVIEREQPNYTVPIMAYVLPLSGHSTNLHPDAPAWFARAARYVRDVTSRDAQDRPVR